MGESVVQVFDPTTQAIVDAFTSLYEQGGWLAVAGLAIMFGVRAFRLFGGEDRWASLSINLQRLIVFGSGFVGAVVVAWSTGAPLLMALPGGLVVGLLAMLKHKGTELAGKVVRLTGNAKADYAIRLLLGDESKPPREPEA